MSIVSFLNIMMMLTLASCCDEDEFSESTVSNIVVSLQKYYYSGCIFLLHSEDLANTRPAEYTLTKIRHHISEHGIATSMMSISLFHHKEEQIQCRNSHPLNVIMFTDTQAINVLCKLSQITSLSSSIWFILIDRTANINEVLKDCCIPFDCIFLVGQRDENGSIILKEIYTVARGFPLLIDMFGYWNSGEDFSFPQVDFYHRRSNLQGLVISAATIENPPITVPENKDGKIIVKGFFGTIWSILEEKMNFTTNFTLPEDGARGLVMDNGTANGMIKMVQDNEVHVGVDAFGMSGIRAKAVDFTVPVISTKYCVLIKPPDSLKLQWDNFLSPFSFMLWIAMMVTVLVIAIHLTILYYLGQCYGNQEAEEIKLYTLSDSLLLVLGIFCQQGHESTPRSYSCRFVCISTYIIAVMIFGTYSATFISFLTVHDNKLPYTDLKSLLQKGSYTFGVSSLHAQNYISAPSRDFLNKTYHGKQPEIHMTVLEGIKKVCNSKHAFLIPLDTALAFTKKVDCNIVPLPDETSLYIPQGIVIAKYSPYKGLLNYNLNVLRSNGVLFRARSVDNLRTFSKEKRTWTRVGLEEVAPIISFLLAGILAAAIVLLLERLTPRRLMSLQQRRGIFCCIASLRHNGMDNTDLNDYYRSRIDSTQYPRIEFTHNSIWQVEENPASASSAQREDFVV